MATNQVAPPLRLRRPSGPTSWTLVLIAAGFAVVALSRAQTVSARSNDAIGMAFRFGTQVYALAYDEIEGPALVRWSGSEKRFVEVSWPRDSRMITAIAPLRVGTNTLAFVGRSTLDPASYALWRARFDQDGMLLDFSAGPEWQFDDNITALHRDGDRFVVVGERSYVILNDRGLLCKGLFIGAGQLVSSSAVNGHSLITGPGLEVWQLGSVCPLPHVHSDAALRLSAVAAIRGRWVGCFRGGIHGAGLVWFDADYLPSKVTVIPAKTWYIDRTGEQLVLWSPTESNCFVVRSDGLERLRLADHAGRAVLVDNGEGPVLFCARAGPVSTAHQAYLKREGVYLFPSRRMFLTTREMAAVWLAVVATVTAGVLGWLAWQRRRDKEHLSPIGSRRRDARP
jgi:hypothetical protein